MTDFGNQLRHAYHLTKDDMVWDVIRDHLPPLKSFVEQRIREGGQ
ncbi:MAG: HepT-like ribonuclease domain-containing protein [Tardiphaga sp.]